MKKSIPPVLSSLLVAASVTVAGAAEHVVCATDSDGCDFVGNRAMQDAVDRANSGDTIDVRAGTYYSEGYRDVPYEDVVARGYVTIDGKNLRIAGEAGTVLDGRGSSYASAIVVARGSVAVENLVIRDFKPELAEDNVYDGHGVFVIDGSAVIAGVTFERIEKMAVSIRGDSNVVLESSKLLDGHVGVWTEETAKITVRDSEFRNNDSAGIAAYASSVVTVSGSMFDGNLDDGIYAAGDAAIDVSHSVFVRNEPYAVRSVDNAQIRTVACEFRDNAADRYLPQ